MRIAQISDFHFTHITWNPFRLFSKRILGNLNWLTQRKSHFSEKQLDPLPQLLTELGVDLVLLGGDFTTTALKEEYEKAADFVKKISIPWLAIPGNHDHYTWRSHRKKHFYRYFTNKRKEITHPVDFFTLKDHGIEAHQIEPHLWIIALDTARATNPYSSEGLFSEKLESYLEEVLKLIPVSDSIFMLNHYPFFQNDETRRNLKRNEALQAILKRDPRIRLYLHGHTHRHTIADLQVSQLPLILDSGSCAQGKKGTWNLIDLKPEGCTISTYRFFPKDETSSPPQTRCLSGDPRAGAPMGTYHFWTKTHTDDFAWTRK